jgi:hypothetical protein
MTTPAPTPAPAPAPAASDGKTLGIVGLVLAFLFSLAGLIVSIIARKQSKAAGVSNGPATAGIIISIIGLVITVIAIVVSVLGAMALLSACADLAPGVYDLEGGGTLTCG